MLDGLLGLLPHDVVLTLGGAGGLAVVYSVVRIVSAMLKTMQDTRIENSRILQIDSETRRSHEETRLMIEEANAAGVGTMARIVNTLRDRITQLESHSFEQDEEISTLKARARAFRSLVLRMIGEIAAVVADAPKDIGDRLQATIERFKRDADLT